MKRGLRLAREKLVIKKHVTLMNFHVMGSKKKPFGRKVVAIAGRKVTGHLRLIIIFNFQIHK